MSGIGTIEHKVTARRANAPRSWTRLEGVESMGKRMCSIVGCSGSARKRGWCGMHYQRWQASGDPTKTSRAVNIDPEQAAGIMRAAGVEPTIPYPGRKTTPWPGTCMVCGADVSPRLAHLLSGQGACDPCARARWVKGEEHPLWGGDSVSYATVHSRLKRYRGKASDYPCADCGSAAYDWSYRGEAERELLSKTGRRYSTDLTDYSPRCRVCHRSWDAKLREVSQ